MRQPASETPRTSRRARGGRLVARAVATDIPALPLPVPASPLPAPELPVPLPDSGSAPPLPPLVTADPTVQANVCGNGVGVLGSGTGANCTGSQQSSPGDAGGTGAALDVSPAVQADLRATGVGVLGAGSTPSCDASQSAGGGSALTDAATTLAAVPAGLVTSSLAFTGGNAELTALLGIGPAGAGSVMVRSRRFGYKG